MLNRADWHSKAGPSVALSTAVLLLCPLALLLATPPAAAGVSGRSPGTLAADGAWILDYLAGRPRHGDRLPDRLFIALAEGEERWAIAYLDRLTATIMQDEGQAPDATSRAATTAVRRAIGYYQELLRSWAGTAASPRPDAAATNPGGRVLIARAWVLVRSTQARHTTGQGSGVRDGRVGTRNMTRAQRLLPYRNPGEGVRPTGTRRSWTRE